ncbi:site-specific integrase [Acidicapsa acidisoli]|uniref:site-specific integrase n=1 Tax=Acidicapsa acidisoli TaxID=1615681 RepID=UPI0021E0EA48|nr:site-specific integrase [Acidicapsa acidisoli]
MPEHHTILGGKVHVYKRDDDSRYWQCASYLAGKNRRETTKEASLAKAKDFAEDWYLGLRGKIRDGELITEKTFRDAATQFEREYEIITEGQRNRVYVNDHKRRLRIHLVPFFGNMGLSKINPGQVQEYRIHRLEEAMKVHGKPPARNTMHQEIVTLRQTLKTAVRHQWLQYLPDLSEPYRASGKISHRAWFSPEEYKKLYEATRKRMQHPKNPRYKWESEQLHDYVLFMANTGLRPDEAARLQFRDVTIVEDDATNETILEIEVRGKRGVGYCKSTTGAVRPFERLRDRNSARKAQQKQKAQPTDLIFPKTHRELFNTILKEENLKTDREGQARTAYSLRHTYICLRLMEGADIYQIAKNCRTSVEMIEKYYASHIKTSLDAAAINIRKKKPLKKAGSESRQEA